MPQLAQLPEVFWSQLFWLLVVFGTIFVVIGLGMLPKIESTVDARDGKIVEDLGLAERARTEADEIDAAYRAKVEQGKAEAMKAIQASRQQSAREAEERIKAADAEIGARIRVAEARIAEATAAAMSEVEKLAAEAAQEMVVRLSGVTVARDRAAKAVKGILNG